MGPLSYMRSVVDWNIVMWRMTVYILLVLVISSHSSWHPEYEHILEDKNVIFELKFFSSVPFISIKKQLQVRKYKKFWCSMPSRLQLCLKMCQNSSVMVLTGSKLKVHILISGDPFLHCQVHISSVTHSFPSLLYSRNLILGVRQCLESEADLLSSSGTEL
jgi:hypothetical protein